MSERGEVTMAREVLKYEGERCGELKEKRGGIWTS